MYAPKILKLIIKQVYIPVICKEVSS